MSYTQLKRVLSNGDVVSSDFTLRNAHGWGAFVFDVLAVEYLGWTPHSWCFKERGEEDALWRLVNDDRLQPCERIVLALCFDRAWIAACDVQDVIAPLLDFAGKHHTDRDRACHLRRVAAILRDEWKTEDGLGFYGMSVSEDPWCLEVECPTCGEIGGLDARPFNVRKDRGALMLKLDALRDCTPGAKWIESGPDAARSRAGSGDE